MFHKLNFPRVRYSDVPEGVESHLMTRRFELIFASFQWLGGTGRITEIMLDSARLFFGAEMYLHSILSPMKSNSSGGMLLFFSDSSLFLFFS